MNEGFISKTSLIAYSAWIAASVLFFGSWYVAIFRPEHWLYAGMSMATALGFTAIATVAHYRLYTLRTCSLIRALGRRDGSDGGGPTEIRAVR